MNRVVAVLALAVLSCKGDTPPTRELGATCATNADCDTLCLPPPDWPGGFCTHDCVDDGDCPADAGCFMTDQGLVCLFLCEDDRDCEFLDPEMTGWLCAVAGSARACLGP